MIQQWWPEFHAGEIQSPAVTAYPRAPGRALFFTGGVDSAFALRQLEGQVDELIFVEGFDVELADGARLESIRRSLETVAANTGHKLIVVRTNLRSHRKFQSVHWETAHVGALAAVAHTLGDHLGTVFVADSDVPPPFGSNPELDELWSSDSVALRSIGAGSSRLQRVRTICDYSPVIGHLRVCWENLAESLNCGRCKKCLLTRLQLRAAGDATEMRSFPDIPLVEALERLVREDPGSRFPHFWRDLQSHLDEPRIQKAIESLLNPETATSLKRQSRWKQPLRRLLGRRA